MNLAFNKRILSIVVLLPVFLLIVMAGPVWLFGAVIVLVAALAQWELTGMFEQAGVRTYRIIGLLGGILVTASFGLPESERVVFTGVLLAMLAASLWRPRGEAMSNARHRNMMNVILGESMEHSRLFEQAASGFEDVLGRRTDGAARVGEVLPSRWQE